MENLNFRSETTFFFILSPHDIKAFNYILVFEFKGDIVCNFLHCVRYHRLSMCNLLDSGFSTSKRVSGYEG